MMLKRRQTGSSLLEVVLAVALLGTAFLVIAETFQLGARIQAAARERVRASLLAQAKMEEILAKPYAEVQPSAVERALEGQFDRVVEVVVPESSPELKQVIVTVAWGGPFGWSREQLRTFVGYDPNRTASYYGGRAERVRRLHLSLRGRRQ